MKGLNKEEEKILIPDGTILLGWRGSIAHGTYIPSSDPDTIDDKDIMGVRVSNMDCYTGLKKWEQLEKMYKSWDSVVYDVKKMFSLLLKCNPNVLSLLFLNETGYIIKTELGNLLLNNRDIFLSRKAYMSFSGYAKSQAHKMENSACQGYMGEKRKRLVEQFGYDCYEENTTDFLTNSGWKRFDQVTEDDKLATSTRGGQLEFQKPISKTDKLYSGNMYIVEPYGSKSIVTKNHNMFVSPCKRSLLNGFSTRYKEEKSNWQLKSISNILKGRRSHYHFRVKLEKKYNPEGRTIRPGWLEIMGLYLSEGSTQFRTNSKGEKTFKCIKITQTKNGKSKVFDIMDQYGCEYGFKRYDYEKETIWISHSDFAKQIYEWCGHKDEKHLPNWCFDLPKFMMEILWNSLLLGDGTFKKQNKTYYTSLKKLADDIQAALFISGIHSCVYGPFKSITEFGEVDMYHVVESNIDNKVRTLNFGRILRKNKTPKKKEGFPIKEIEVKNKRVVCFEVLNGTLVTRNNGKPAIHGNCKNAAHLIRLLRMGIEFLRDGRLYVNREHDAGELIDIKKGRWTLEKVKKEAERLFALAEEAYVRTDLPVDPNYQEANRLLEHIILSYHGYKDISEYERNT